ncbi:MAG: D-alanine--D-alanine ligase B [Phycisphaerae bacterium]|nr:D-alanine--D-alanine ligase B [Phycisphaerae bacterium]
MKSIGNGGAGRGPLRVTVLAGGVGVEREVSLQSGAGVFEAMRRLGHHAALRDISPNDLSALDEPADFVFIALHGEFGEDGGLQHELDRRGIAYCGSGAEASSAAFNKVTAKRRFAAAGVPTPAYVVATAENLEDALARMHPPCVVKPSASGSSVGTSIPKDRASLAAAARERINAEGEALIEQYIRGPELTVGVLGEAALPVCQIRTKREFYDYQAKYLDDDTEYLFDVDLPEELLARVQRLSLAAHRALGCEVFSRVDWMIDGGSGSPFALEVNTIPGFTSHSLLPKAAARVGITFDGLVQRIVDASLDRWEARRCDGSARVRRAVAV